MISLRHQARWGLALASAIAAFSLVGCSSNQSSSGSPRLTFIVVTSNAGLATGVGAGSSQVTASSGNIFDGENLDGPEPVDENNGWGHMPTSSTSKVTFTWIPKDPTQQPFGNWAGIAVAFKAGP